METAFNKKNGSTTAPEAKPKSKRNYANKLFLKTKPKPIRGGGGKDKRYSEPSEDQQSMKEYIKTQAHEIFVESIPLESIKQLPTE